MKKTTVKALAILIAVLAAECVFASNLDSLSDNTTYDNQTFKIDTVEFNLPEGFIEDSKYATNNIKGYLANEGIFYTFSYAKNGKLVAVSSNDENAIEEFIME